MLCGYVFEFEVVYVDGVWWCFVCVVLFLFCYCGLGFGKVGYVFVYYVVKDWFECCGDFVVWQVFVEYLV